MTVPTDIEQLYLELVNSARLDPLQNAARFINSYTPLVSGDARIQSALNFFGVSGTALGAAFGALTPVQPLAWNDALGTAARTHSQLMITHDQQSHQLSGEAGLGARITAAGYTGWSGLAENIFAFSETALHGHAGLMVDWGSGPGGMQSPPGHRTNIMNAAYREIGIGAIEEANPATSVGPQVLTQDFGARFAGPAVLLLGVAYQDTDANSFYSLGEGAGGMTVAVGGSGAVVSAASGGYTLGLGAGTHAITFTGGLLSLPVTFTATLGTGTNAKIDIVGDTILKTSVSGTVAGSVSRIEALGTVGLTLAGDAGNQTIVGNAGANPLLRGDGGADTIYGGAGDDWIEGEAGVNPFSGVAGADLILGEAGNDTVLGGPGNDTIAGGAGIDTLLGDAGNDIIAGEADNDNISGGEGDDTLLGQSGNDVVFGDLGNDIVYGGDGDDIMMGELGDATVSVGGIDVLYGEAGNDSIHGGANGDGIDGGIGNDLIDGGNGSDAIAGGLGVDLMIGSGMTQFTSGQFPAGTSGDDVFIFYNIYEAGDQIYGFDTRAGNADKLYLVYLFDSLGYAGMNPRGDGYLQVAQNGPDTQVQIDADGAAGSAAFNTLVSLMSVTANTIDDSFFYFQ